MHAGQDTALPERRTVSSDGANAMYGRPDHRVGVEEIWDGFFTAVGGLRTLACDPPHVYT
eukprot:3915201-Prymnesium_polylepis.1